MPEDVETLEVIKDCGSERKYLAVDMQPPISIEGRKDMSFGQLPGLTRKRLVFRHVWSPS